MRRHPGLAGALALTVVLTLAAAACSARSGPAPAPPAGQAGSAAAGGGTTPPPPAGAGQPGTAPASRAGRICPVTVANGSVPPGEGPSGDVPQYHGNGALWTALPAFGVVVARPDEVGKKGDVDMKFGWWRGVKGRLTISGHRLDGAAGPVKAEIPGGYTATGFQATGIDFPTEGCWEVTGSVGTSHLTFVVIVVKASRWLLTSR